MLFAMLAASHAWMCQSLTVDVDEPKSRFWIAGRQADTERLVVIGVAEDAGNFGRDVAADTVRGVAQRLGADVENEAVAVERTSGA